MLETKLLLVFSSSTKLRAELSPAPLKPAPKLSAIFAAIPFGPISSAVRGRREQRRAPDDRLQGRGGGHLEAGAASHQAEAALEAELVAAVPSACGPTRRARRRGRRAGSRSGCRSWRSGCPWCSA
jgi:hypothetical protein